MSDATQTVSARTQSRCRLVILLLLFIHSPQVVAESVVVLGSLEFPPYTGKRLHQGGVITQIVREAFARTGYRAEVRYYPWARAMGMAREGDLDGLAMVWMRDERKEWLLFSEPVSTSEVVFYKRTTRAFAFDGTDYLALKPYRIGIVKDYANPEAFEAARRHLQIQAVTSDLQNLGKLAAGRLDLVVIDRLVALHLLRTQMVESANSFDWVSPPLSTEQNYVGISREAPAAQEKLAGFNRGLAILKQEGRIRAILSEHGLGGPADPARARREADETGPPPGKDGL